MRNKIKIKKSIWPNSRKIGGVVSYKKKLTKWFGFNQARAISLIVAEVQEEYLVAMHLLGLVNFVHPWLN